MIVRFKMKNKYIPSNQLSESQNNLKPLVGLIRFVVKGSCLIRPSNNKKYSLGRKPFVSVHLRYQTGYKSFPSPTPFVCFLPGDPCTTVSNGRSREGGRKHSHHTSLPYRHIHTHHENLLFFFLSSNVFRARRSPP